MEALQRVTASCVSSTMTTSMRYGSCTGGGGVSLSSAGSVGDGVGLTFAADVAVSDQFPVGLRVLVVDDDTTCLRILEQMLHRCLYNVTSCTQAAAALTLLREKKGCFDVVLSDVHMPDMDGYKLLELVGLEMDLPVIMVSADGRTSAVMKGIKHGACDYLIKPIREEELKNIWQHVVRKKCNENKEGEYSWSMEDSDRQRRANDDTEYASSINEGTGVLKGQKKRSNAKEEDEGELDNDDPSSSKKPRVVWSVELHQQFVIAVNQLGLDKAVPKRILELMNVPGLTRENVASHLQKFRLYLKRLSAQQHSGIANNLFGSLESNVKMGSLGRFDIQALAASGQIPPQTLAAMHAELLGRPTGSLGPIIDQHALLHTSLEGPKHVPVEHSVAFGQPLVKSQCNIAKHVSQAVLSTDRFSSGFGPWLSSNVGTVGSNNNIAVLNSQNSKVLMDIMQQDHQQCLEQKQPSKLQQQSMLPEPSRSMNVQPSCLVLPSQSSASIQAVNSPVSVNQISSLNRASLIDYCNLLPPSNNSTLGDGHVSNGGINTSSVLSGYSSFDSCSTLLPCSFSADKTTVSQSSTLTFGNAGQFPGNVCNISDVQGPYGAKSGEVLGHGPFRHLGFISNGSLPIRLAVDECESMSNMNHNKIHIENNGNVVKLEPSSDIVESARVGVPIVQ